MMFIHSQDDDDEFEHLQDDDEFEGFDKERNVKGNGHEKPPDLKITKVGGHIPRCTIERVVLLSIIVIKKMTVIYN